MNKTATMRRCLRSAATAVTALLLLAGVTVTQAQTTGEILLNGDFATGDLTNWTTFSGEGATADFAVTDGAATVTNVEGTSGTSWHLQLNQELTADQIGSLTVGERYTLSFDAKSSTSARQIRVFFGQNAVPFTALAAENIELSTDMRNYAMTVVVTETFDAMKLGFELGQTNDDVTIDNVSLAPTENVLTNADFASGDLTDWSTFIADFEGVSADFGVVDGAAAITNIAGASGTSWHVQLNQIFTADQTGSLELDAVYTVEFDAKSSAEGRKAKLFVGKNSEPFTALVDSTFELTTDFQRYSVSFPMASVFNDPKLGFEFGFSNDDATIDNVVLYKGGNVGTEPEPEPQEPNDPLGDNFIFFVEGVNTAIPSVGGSTVTDQVDAENRGNVRQISGGSFFQTGFFWEDEGGVDFTANINDVDTVYFKARLNPADFNNDEARYTVGLTIADVTNGTDQDLQFGITWRFPAADYDNTWHEYTIPLPKATWAAHDSALKDLDVNGDPLPESEQYNDAQRRWTFDPAWSGVTGSEVGPEDDRFKNVEWENLGRVAISLGNNLSGTAYIDDFYIGSESAVDLSVATAAATPASGLTATEVTTDSVRVSWDAAANDVGSFNLYYSGSEITDVTAEDVFSLGNFRADGATEFTHAVYRPINTEAPGTYHYAIEATNLYSYTPPDAVPSKTSIAPTGKTIAHIFSMNDAEQQSVFDMLTAGNMDQAEQLFSTKLPFKLGDDAFAANSDAYNGLSDASADVYVGHGQITEGSDTFNTFFFYIEALDDDILGGPSGNPGDMTGTTEYPNDESNVTWVPGPNADPKLEWNFYLKDQIQVHFGTYFVDNFVTGTTHDLRQRGAEPDYYLSFQPKVSTAGDALPDGMLTRLWLTSPDTENPDAEYKTDYYNSEVPLTYTPVYENLLNENNERIGWRALIAIDAIDLLKATDGDATVDAEFTPPGPTDIRYMPFMLSLVDKDGEDVDAGNWWEQPSNTFNFPSRGGLGGGVGANSSNITNLGTVAIVGSDITVSNEEDLAELEVPGTFKLHQNYPNPFNPATRINFELAQTSDVTLTIYNMLGQKVATLVNNQTMTAGAHGVNFDASRLSSGMYLYRIEAGSFVSTKKMMLIK